MRTLNWSGHNESKLVNYKQAAWKLLYVLLSWRIYYCKFPIECLKTGLGVLSLKLPQWLIAKTHTYIISTRSQ